ncbi:mitochondrial import inner membrane translocase subunit Tim10-like [Watersipora subatra]|uniref:mitochondrial import inner membrane translocase subunit Tim10-like n=1 Tax=Watersipora subatra TaxID=2589382 RepID=UPI00355C0174
MALTDAQAKLLENLELEMMADMYNRMTAACQKKCVPPKYNDSELTKGESVCIDRCVAKFMDVHDRIGKKLTAMSNTDQGAGAAATNLPGTMPK